MPVHQLLKLFMLSLAEVRNHLFENGIDKSYTKWRWHGETGVSYTSYRFDPHDDINQDFGMQTPYDAKDTDKMLDATREQYDGKHEKFIKLIEDANRPLYDGCLKFTKLSAVVGLFNTKAKCGWSDKSFTILLKLIRELLPPDNILPLSMGAVKKILSVYGMKYEKIHACPNDCILYRKDYVDAHVCPTCGLQRYKENNPKTGKNKGVPAKTLWYFPPIPRFRTMFQSSNTSKSLTWHANERVIDDKLRHPADSPAWKLIDNKWPKFAAESRNLRLALSSDGVNPYRSLNSTYSCWPVMLVTYNLPPWLCMKRKFMMLTMLIAGRHQPGNDIDIYLEPLIDDLQILWKTGVEAYDAYQHESFTLRAVLLWTISDFPAYGNLSGSINKGYFACPICTEDTSSVYLKHSRKNVYITSRRWLSRYHPYQSQKKAFNGEKELRLEPKILSGCEVLRRVEGIKNSWGKMKTLKKNRKVQTQGEEDANIPTKCWKKKSIFFELEYWEHLLVRHNLDVMHIEKNVCDIIIGTLLDIPGKTKDNVKSRFDLISEGLRMELAPNVGATKSFLPPACYTLTKADKMRVCTILHKLRVPQGYSSNFKSLVSLKDLKLYGLKTHDCHVLMQELLPVAIRSVLPKHVRFAIIRLCFFFKAICVKVVDVQQLDELQKEVVITLCLLEKYFPPSFFDIMVHLTLHLVREIRLCGPVYFRWMYTFERYMSVLKGYVRNRNHPEACIAESYISEEAIEFCTEFLPDLLPIGIPCPKKITTDDMALYGKLPTGGILVQVERIDLEQAHHYVLQNTDDVQPYIEEHMDYLRKNQTRKSKTPKRLQEEHNRTFAEWLKKRVSEERIGLDHNMMEALKWISRGPLANVLKYTSYVVSGYQFLTKERDDKRVTQNSGVSLTATTMQVASAKDKNPIYSEMRYYGVIREIWVLDYCKFKIPMFKCDWVDNTYGIKTDEMGFTLVDRDKIGHKSDSFIFASQAKQVFYVDDPSDLKWSVVLDAPPRCYDHDSDNEDENPNDENLGDNTNAVVLPSVEAFDDVRDESHLIYMREGGEGFWVDNNS